MVLGNLKVALWALTQTAQALQDGLGNSLTTPDIRLTDNDPTTGEPRDPAESINLANTALEHLTRALTQAACCVETAQTEINGQGYVFHQVS